MRSSLEDMMVNLDIIQDSETVKHSLNVNGDDPVKPLMYERNRPLLIFLLPLFK